MNVLSSGEGAKSPLSPPKKVSLVLGLSALFVLPCCWILFGGKAFSLTFWTKFLIFRNSTFKKWKKDPKLIEMAGDEIDQVVTQFAKTSVEEVEDVEKEVSFAGQGLKLDTEKDAFFVVEAINNCPNMTTLCMEGNTLGVDAAKAVAKSLESQPKFRRALWKDMFTGRLKSEIPDALQFLSSGIILAGARLYELDLSDNAFGPIGVKAIVTLLKSSACQTLKELRLNNNGLGITGGKLLAEALRANVESSTLGKTFALKTFICGRNRLENPGAQALASVFKNLGSLEDVQMPQNGIYHEGISALGNALSQNSSLRIVNFNDNTFTEKGAKAFASNMEKLQELEVINLGDCLLKTEGALAIADAIREGHLKLREVHLGFNEIRKEGGIALAEAMENKLCLQRLELNGNAFGTEGCQMVEGTMEAINMATQLGSMSDDEGGDDDDSEDQGEDYDNEEGDEYGDENGDVSKEDDTNDVVEVVEKENLKPVSTNGVILTSKISVDAFLKFPNAETFLQLGNNRVSLLIEKLSGDTSTWDCLDLFIKVSTCLSVNSDEDTQREVFTICDKYLETAFRVVDDQTIIALTNDLLIHLGLIKCEDKRFRPPIDLNGPFLVLSYCCPKPYFSRATKDTLQYFLSQPNKAADKCGKVKHSLMRVLFQM